jgi:Conjugative transposon protein TcpC
MRDRKKWKARTGMAGKIVLGGVLTIVGIRYSVLTYKDLTRPDNQTVQAATDIHQIPRIPEAARGTAEMFLTNWYFTAEKETVASKEKRLLPYISPTVEATLRGENVIPMSAMTPLRVKAWDEKEKWLEPGKRAVLTYRVMLEDGRNLLVSVPVVKAGAWMVDGLPALLPDPAKGTPPSPDKPSIDSTALTEIQTALDAFFPMWLSGKEESNNRYVIGKLPLDNVLGKVQGVYEEVAIQPIGEKPVTVKALVKIRTADETLSSEYTIVLEEVEGQWKIKELY